MFSCVCKSWHHASKACNLVKLRQRWSHQMPWLMSTDGHEEITSYEHGDTVIRSLRDFEESDSDIQAEEEEVVVGNNDIQEEADSKNSIQAAEVVDNVCARNMLNISNRKCYTFDCPQGYGTACWGSSTGWVVTAGLDDDMYLFNPLTKSQLDLPCRSTLPGRFKATKQSLRIFLIDKAVVLKLPKSLHGCDNSNETLLAVVFYGLAPCLVAIAQPGDTKWTQVTWPNDQDTTHVMDVVYHNDLGLVFVGQCGGLVCCNIYDKEQPLSFKWYQPPLSALAEDSYNNVTYIANYCNDLLLISREMKAGLQEKPDVYHYYSGYFEVYKFNFVGKCWKELLDLQDVAIFLGNNSTMAVYAPDAGCEANSIYFTDDNRSGYCYNENKVGGHDMGVYRVGDRTFQHLSVVGDMRSTYGCPFWFIPLI